MNSFCCRSCGSSRGRLVLDLGVQPLANNLLRPEDLATEEPRFPLRVAVCTECWMLQITDIVPPESLFSEYLYFPPSPTRCWPMPPPPPSCTAGVLIGCPEPGGGGGEQ